MKRLPDVATARPPTVVDNDADVFDFDRLERVVAELIEERHRLGAENDLLRKELVQREQKIAELDSRLTQQEQRRTDALKRLDDLLAQVEGFATLATQAAEG
ncbi:MAG: hypothetical protein QF570_06655 [Myxococcota bacterium]|nr:hypothetical protein [Myxococcota bacterium]